MEDPFPVGVVFDSNSKSVVFGFGRDPAIDIWEKQEQLLKWEFEKKIGLGGKLHPSHKWAVQQFEIGKIKADNALSLKRRNIFGVKANYESASKGYKTFFLVLEKKKGERIIEFLKKHLGKRHDTIIINSKKEKKLKNTFIPYFNESYEQIILTFGKEKKDREKEPFDHGPLFELRDSKVTQELFNELLKDSLETIQKKSNQNQDWNFFFENIIYDKENLGLDSLSVVPEIKNEINIDLTEEEYLDSIKGIRSESIASKDDINAAKAEILKVIEEIAKKEHVELKNTTKEELANLSIILLKKIGEGI